MPPIVPEPAQPKRRREDQLPPEPKMGLGTAIGKKLKTYFFTGILVAAPVGVTIYIAWSIIDFVDQRIAPFVPISTNYGEPVHIPGLGLIILLLSLTLIGAITTNILGRLLVVASDKIMARTPIVRGIYSLLKQMAEMLFGEKKTAYRQVVLVPYPQDDSWILGFVTGDSFAAINKASGSELVSVFVPLTPNPTSGLLLYYPRSKVKELDITVEDGWKVILSTGIAVPEKKGRAA